MSEYRTTKRDTVTNERARSLRKADNMPEAVLWNELKDRMLGGHKFVRQFPIGPYFADFLCRRARLVVEVDGSQHADSNYDRRRDEDVIAPDLRYVSAGREISPHRLAVLATSPQRGEETRRRRRK